VSTKLVAVRLLTVMSAVGATPPLFSMSVTREDRELTVDPKLLKFEIKGYRVSLCPFDQQSQLIWRVLPLPRMGWAESGVWQRRFRMMRGVNCVCTRLKMPDPSGPGAVTK